MISTRLDSYVRSGKVSERYLGIDLTSSTSFTCSEDSRECCQMFHIRVEHHVGVYPLAPVLSEHGGIRLDDICF